MTIRTKNRGLVYLRRSNSKQEASLETQLAWAIAKAIELGVSLSASLADLQYMLTNRLSSCKSIRIDDAISGDCMSRPGFLALMDDAVKDRSISHIFVYRRDRLARPEDAMAMASVERRVREKGITIVMVERIAGPRRPGVSDIGDDLAACIEYYQSGEYLLTLARRVIDGQQRNAAAGHWNGGRAPYGFVRVLVDAQGNVVEELVDGRTIKQAGYHVEIRPKDDPAI
jgi:DNA invertase Pin-like site-specific DNA recombinase